MDDATTYTTWFDSAQLSSKFAYVLACAAQDRHDAHVFWKAQDTVASQKIAEDAKATYEAIKRLSDDVAAGKINFQYLRNTEG